MNKQSGLLKRLKPETIEELADALRTSDKQAQLDAARELADRGEVAVEPLIDALEDNNEQVWQIAFATLVKIGDPAIPPLMATLEHRKRNVRLMAAAILLRIGIPASTSPRLFSMQQELLQQVTASR